MSGPIILVCFFWLAGADQSALQYYTEASRTNPDYLAPQFGLGQMHLVNNDLKRAAQCFERVLRTQVRTVKPPCLHLMKDTCRPFVRTTLVAEQY